MLGCVVFLTPLPLVPPPSMAAAAVTVFLTAALDRGALVSALRARAQRSSLLRGMFGIINVLLFFPSGALYPVESYPEWLAKLSAVDPLTYGVRALRGLSAAGRGAAVGLRGLDLSRDLHDRVRGADEGPIPARGLGDFRFWILDCGVGMTLRDQRYLESKI